jgi:hypothetical protein
MQQKNLACERNGNGEAEFTGVESLDDFAAACRICREEEIRKGRMRIDAYRYVFLAFDKLRHRRLLGLLARGGSARLDPRLMTRHFTGMLNALLDGRRLPESICAELLENHLESPLRVWCERLIVFARIIRLEGTMERVLAGVRRRRLDRRRPAKGLGRILMWPRFVLNRLNLATLRFQVDTAIFLVGLFVRRRRNFVELAWEVEGDQLTLEVSNNARIPPSLETIAAERVQLACTTASAPVERGRAEVGLREHNIPLTRHHLAGSGLGMILVASAAFRYGGQLTPPRYDPDSDRTVAVFTAAVEKLPLAAAFGAA